MRLEWSRYYSPYHANIITACVPLRPGVYVIASQTLGGGWIYEYVGQSDCLRTGMLGRLSPVGDNSILTAILLETKSGFAFAEVQETYIRTGAVKFLFDKLRPNFCCDPGGEPIAVNLPLLVKPRQQLEKMGFRFTELDFLEAAHNGNLVAVSFFLEERMSPNTECQDGYTALMLAAQSGSADVVRSLVQSGADVNASCSHMGKTALMFAAEKRGPDVVRLLLQARARVNKKDFNKATALWYAAASDDPESARILLEYGAKVDSRALIGGTPLIVAAGTRSLKIVELLLSAGAKVNKKDEDGKTALWWAEKNYHPSIIKILRESGAKL